MATVYHGSGGVIGVIQAVKEKKKTNWIAHLQWSGRQDKKKRFRGHSRPDKSVERCSHTPEKEEGGISV